MAAKSSGRPLAQPGSQLSCGGSDAASLLPLELPSSASALGDWERYSEGSISSTSISTGSPSGPGATSIRAYISEASTLLATAVSAALANIRPEFRAVVELVDLGDQSYQEAADRLGCPIGTVMSRLHRGRKALREQLRTYAVAEGFVAAA